MKLNVEVCLVIIQIGNSNKITFAKVEYFLQMSHMSQSKSSISLASQLFPITSLAELDKITIKFKEKHLN